MSRKRITNLAVIRGLIVPLAAVFLLCCASNDAAAAGGKERQRMFRAVPAKLRPQLIKKLNQYILYRRTHQWGKLYDLYSKRYLSRRWPPLGMTREEFVQGNRQDDATGRGDNLLRFKADKVNFIQGTDDAPARVAIFGCGEYYTNKAGLRVGPSRKLKSLVEALYENGEWRLTDVIVDYRCEECEADKCRMN